MAIDRLRNILNTWRSKRLDLVRQFQEDIWNGAENNDDPGYDILNAWAVDMEYYQPNVVWRMEDKSFYGDERLKEMILSTIDQLKTFQPKVSGDAKCPR